MKSRFSCLDLQAMIAELRPRIVGLRVANIYDINKKTYLLKLAKTPDKAVLLIESGIRIHTTEYDWPKNNMPSGFAMKCRKHIRTKRISAIQQLGNDRIVDITFGFGEASYHLIIELYDRGNVVLTDANYSILSLLRTRTDKENADVRFAVYERYPVELAQEASPVDMERLKEAFQKASDGAPLRKFLNPILASGPAVIEHCLLRAGFPPNAKWGENVTEADFDKVLEAMKAAERIPHELPGQGFIIQKAQKKGKDETAVMFDEFHPILPSQYKEKPIKEYPSFDRAVDIFFSEIESQKMDMKALQQEQSILKKLDNFKKSHNKRLEDLARAQEEDERKAQLIECNLDVVDQAIKIICSAIANSMSWDEIEEMVSEAKALSDPVAKHIHSLQLSKNHLTLALESMMSDSEDSDDYDDSESEEDEDGKPSAPKKKGKNMKSKQQKKTLVEIDLDLTAYANARMYYDKKRHAKVKQEKTEQSSKKALKSAQRKTDQTLKEVSVSVGINKARKQFWFERFFWFISTENYLVVGGRDRQQNEQIVRRHLKKGDIYVHADLHGASSVVIKNQGDELVPPSTLAQAGHMAVLHSASWNAKTVTSAYWVYNHQVSKTAPSGEYLTTGSFMIRGKKNFLQPTQLVCGFGLLFRVDESCIARHLNERRVKSKGDFGKDAAKTEEDGKGKLGNSVQQKEEKGNQKEAKEPENLDETSEPKQGESENVIEAANNTGSSEKNQEESKKQGDDGDIDNNDKDDSEDDSEDDSADDEGNKDDEETLADAIAYPDTSIDVSYSRGESVRVETQESSELSRQASSVQDEPDDHKRRGPRKSAKQRRDEKKRAQGKTVNSDAAKQAKAQAQQAANKPPSQPQLSRGQKSKRKKIQQKYADQDEEERAMKMAIISSTNENKPLSKKDKRKARKEAKIQRAKGVDVPANADVAKTPKAPVAEFKPMTEEEMRQRMENKDEAISQLVVAQEEAEIRAILESENIQLLDDEEKESVTYLNTLTGCPDPDDILLYAIPMCGPYSSMQNFKYKVKMVPGTAKKGRALRSVIHGFSSLPTANGREKELMKAIKGKEFSFQKKKRLVFVYVCIKSSRERKRDRDGERGSEDVQR